MQTVPRRQAELKAPVLSPVTLHPSRSAAGDFMGGAGTSKRAVIFLWTTRQLNKGLYKFCELKKKSRQQQHLNSYDFIMLFLPTRTNKTILRATPETGHTSIFAM